jgi:hypothetical protein
MIQETFSQRCLTLIDEYAPGFSSSIFGYDMLTPPDLEKEIGLTCAFTSEKPGVHAEICVVFN